MKRKITKLNLLIIFSFTTLYSEAQTGVSINTTGASPNSFAILDLSNTASKYLLLPSTSLSSLSGAPAGLLAYSGTNLYLYDGTTWQKMAQSSATGTVTSVGLSLPSIFTVTGSPVTSSGTLTGTFNNQNANTYFGNGSGSSAQPSFTSAGVLTKTDDVNVTLTLGGSPTTALLHAASITAGWTGQLSITRGGTGLSSLGSANQLLRVNAAGTSLEYFTPTYGSGTVTSVGLSLPGIFIVSGSPVTTSGTLTGTLANQTAYTIFGNNTGASATPGFFSPQLASALFQNQGTSTHVLLHGNNAGNPSWGAVDLTSDVSGILPIANGGTNSTATPTAGGVIYGNATGTAYAVTSAGTSGQVLTSAGTGTPIWTTVTSLSTVQGATTVYGSSSLSLTTISGTFTTVPGMSTSITVPSNCTAYIATDGGIQTNAGGASGFSTVDIRVFIDGVQQTNGGYRRVTAANTTGTQTILATWSLSFATTLSAGTHTVSVGAALALGSSCTVGGSNTVAGNNFLQPELTIITVTQ